MCYMPLWHSAYQMFTVPVCYDSATIYTTDYNEDSQIQPDAIFPFIIEEEGIQCLREGPVIQNETLPYTYVQEKCNTPTDGLPGSSKRPRAYPGPQYPQQIWGTRIPRPFSPQPEHCHALWCIRCFSFTVVSTPRKSKMRV